MEISMPVGGKNEVIKIPDRNINEIIMPKEKPALPDVCDKIREAIINPIGTKKLAQIVHDKFGKRNKRGGPYYKIAVLVDSFNRPTKHSLLFPPILEELEKAGIKDEEIVIIEGCGVHRPARPEEWGKKWGKELRERFKNQMFSHTAPPHEYEKFHSPVRLIGFTRHNCPVSINQYAAESDVIIVLGQVSMNIAFGFGGGAKMILPGIASYESIVLSHDLTPPGMRKSGTWEHNEGRLDINEMGDVAGVDFIVNVVHNTQGEIVAVAAGNHLEAWRALLPICREMYIRPQIKPADIYICSASPRHTMSGALATDHDWAISGGNRATKPGGTMILAHRAVWPQHPIAHLGCPYFKLCEDMIRAMRPRSMDELVRDCYYMRRWESQIIYTTSSIMNEKEIVISGEGYGEEDFDGSGFKYIPILDEAITYAFKRQGNSATVNVSPFGGRFTYIAGD